MHILFCSGDKRDYFLFFFLSLLDSYTIPTKDVIVMAAYLHNSKALTPTLFRENV